MWVTHQNWILLSSCACIRNDRIIVESNLAACFGIKFLLSSSSLLLHVVRDRQRSVRLWVLIESENLPKKLCIKIFVGGET